MSRLARYFLESEALSLLARMEQVQPFSLTMPMVAAAGLSDEAFRAVTDHLLVNTHGLRQQVDRFVRSLHQAETARLTDEELQARYARLKLRFNAILDQFDIFGDVISQRAEHHTGVWIAGLDVLASDALQLSEALYEAPPVMCFLERGHGAAIRKARTRLPGGDTNPVAIIQVPRERMVGSGIAASLVHEVGHQGAALLDLVASIRNEMRQTAVPPEQQRAWTLYQLWISEIIADFWAMAHLGIGATMGVMSVVSLPRYFMFRVRTDDPHPFPWIRVELSIACGELLYPHRQWAQMRQLWRSLYPPTDLAPDVQAVIGELLAAMPRFVRLLVSHRNNRTRGQPLRAIFPVQDRQPAQLQALYRRWRQRPELLPLDQPSLIFAVVGQARADTKVSAPLEGRLLSRLLTHWAWMRAEDRQNRRLGQMPIPRQAVGKFIS